MGASEQSLHALEQSVVRGIAFVQQQQSKLAIKQRRRLDGFMKRDEARELYADVPDAEKEQTLLEELAGLITVPWAWLRSFCEKPKKSKPN